MKRNLIFLLAILSIPGLAQMPGVVMQVDVDNFRGLTDSRTQNFE